MLAPKTKRSHRIFDDWARRRNNPKRLSRRLWYAVSIMAYWENARIVGETQLNQNFQCPKRVQSYGEGWSAIAINRLTRGLFNQILGSPCVVPEFVGLQCVN